MVGFRDLVGTGIAPVSKKTAVKSGINVGPTFINFGFFFPGPTALLKALHLLNSGFFPRVYRYFQVKSNPKILKIA